MEMILGYARPSVKWQSARTTILAGLVGVVISAMLAVVMVELGTVQRDLKAILILVAGVAMVTATLRPEIGLMILLALMPFEFSFSGTGTDEVLIVAMAVVLIWRIRAHAIPAWVSIGGLSVVVGSFLAVIDAYEPTSALWGGVRWLSAVVILFAALSILRSRRDASRRMVDIFTGSAIVVVVFAFAQSAGIYVLVHASYTPGHASSFFGYYTNYADYVAIAAILATGEVLSALAGRHFERASIYGAAVVVIIVGLAISTSRGGLLAVGVGWLMLLVLNIRRGSVLVQAVVMLMVLGAVGYAAIPSATVAKIEARFSKPLGSLEEDKQRFAVEKAGERALERHPLGIGYANFSYYARAEAHSNQIHRLFAHAQNTPIQMGLDAGWLGGIGFLVLVLWPIGLVLRSGARGQSAIRASACAAALGGFLAQNLFDYMFYEIAFLIFILMLVWGTIHALSIEQSDPGASTTSPAGHRLSPLPPAELASLLGP
jgi:hypothetical protein